MVCWRRSIAVLAILGCWSLVALTSAPAAPAAHAPKIRLRNGTSTNWAGYAIATNLAAPQSKAVSDVGGAWTVPAVTCDAASTYSSTWVGIDGDTDNTVEQTGTEQDCLGGVPSYYAWYEMYPKRAYRISLAIHPGDAINAEVSYAGGSVFVLTLTNATTGQSFTTRQKLNAQRQNAEWIVEAPYSGGVLPLANFGTAAFSGASATVNGQAGPISAWANEAITMAATDGTVKAQPSALNSGGTGFSVAWQHS